MKKNRKKLLLAIIAGMLSLTLAIAGTLMILTDTSDAVVNTVTIANLTVDLNEDTGIDAGAVPNTDGNGYVFPEIDIDGTDPVTYDKAPTITTGADDVPSYIRVMYTFSLDDDTNAAVFTEDQLDDLLNSLKTEVGNVTGAKWLFDTATPSADASTFSGYIYWADSTTGLIEVAGGFSQVLFETWTLPVSLKTPDEDGNIPLLNIPINLELVAEAYQSRTNPGTGTTVADLPSYFPGSIL